MNVNTESAASRRFPRTPAALVAGAGFLSLGFYYVYWLHSRSRILNAMAAQGCKRVPAWLLWIHHACALLAAAVLATLLLRLSGLTSSLEPMPADLGRMILTTEGMAYTVLVFRFRDALLDIHGTGRLAQLNPSVVPSVVLGPLYYQWMINRHDYESAAAQRRAKAEAVARPLI